MAGRRARSAKCGRVRGDAAQRSASPPARQGTARPESLVERPTYLVSRHCSVLKWFTSSLSKMNTLASMCALPLASSPSGELAVTEGCCTTMVAGAFLGVVEAADLDERLLGRWKASESESWPLSAAAWWWLEAMPEATPEALLRGWSDMRRGAARTDSVGLGGGW